MPALQPVVEIPLASNSKRNLTPRGRARSRSIATPQSAQTAQTTQNQSQTQSSSQSHSQSRDESASQSHSQHHHKSGDEQALIEAQRLLGDEADVGSARGRRHRHLIEAREAATHLDEETPSKGRGAITLGSKVSSRSSLGSTEPSQAVGDEVEEGEQPGRHDELESYESQPAVGGAEAAGMSTGSIGGSDKLDIEGASDQMGGTDPIDIAEESSTIAGNEELDKDIEERPQAIPAARQAPISSSMLPTDDNGSEEALGGSAFEMIPFKDPSELGIDLAEEPDSDGPLSVVSSSSGSDAGDDLNVEDKSAVEADTDSDSDDSASDSDDSMSSSSDDTSSDSEDAEESSDSKNEHEVTSKKGGGDDEDEDERAMEKLLQAARKSAAEKAGSQRMGFDHDEAMVTFDEGDGEAPIPDIAVTNMPRAGLSFGSNGAVRAAAGPSILPSTAGPSRPATSGSRNVEGAGMELDDRAYERPLTKREKAAQPKKASTSELWASIPTARSDLLPQMKRDYQALALANSLDPKRFMKGGNKAGKIPETFAIGTMVDASRHLRDTTITKERTYRPGQVVSGLARDEATGEYAKRKYGDLQWSRMENGRGRGRSKKRKW